MLRRNHCVCTGLYAVFASENNGWRSSLSFGLSVGSSSCKFKNESHTLTHAAQSINHRHDGRESMHPVRLHIECRISWWQNATRAHTMNVSGGSYGLRLWHKWYAASRTRKLCAHINLSELVGTQRGSGGVDYFPGAIFTWNAIYYFGCFGPIVYRTRYVIVTGNCLGFVRECRVRAGGRANDSRAFRWRWRSRQRLQHNDALLWLLQS